MARVPCSHVPALCLLMCGISFRGPSKGSMTNDHVCVSLVDCICSSRDSRSSKWFRFQHTDINQLSQKFSLGIINILNLGNITPISPSPSHTQRLLLIPSSVPSSLPPYPLTCSLPRFKDAGFLSMIFVWFSVLVQAECALLLEPSTKIRNKGQTEDSRGILLRCATRLSKFGPRLTSPGTFRTCSIARFFSPQEKGDLKPTN